MQPPTQKWTACRTLQQRVLDAINAMFVDIMVLCRIFWHAFVTPIPLQMRVATSPRMMVLFSGLGSPSFAWMPFLKSFQERRPNTFASLNRITTSNVRALREPMQRALVEDIIPQIEKHVQTWRDRSRIVLIGHSLGAVDALWTSCYLREKYKGTVPIALTALFGAFGTSTAAIMPVLGIHDTVKQSLHRREGPFMHSLLSRARSLPQHPRSTNTFVMAKDDATIRPSSNSLVYGIPGSNKYYSVYGAGHMGGLSCMELPIQRSVEAFFGTGARSKNIL